MDFLDDTKGQRDDPHRWPSPGMAAADLKIAVRSSKRGAMTDPAGDENTTEGRHVSTGVKYILQRAPSRPRWARFSPSGRPCGRIRRSQHRA